MRRVTTAEQWNAKSSTILYHFNIYLNTTDKLVFILIVEMLYSLTLSYTDGTGSFTRTDVNR